MSRGRVGLVDVWTAARRHGESWPFSLTITPLGGNRRDTRPLGGACNSHQPTCADQPAPQTSLLGGDIKEADGQMTGTMPLETRAETETICSDLNLMGRTLAMQCTRSRWVPAPEPLQAPGHQGDTKTALRGLDMRRCPHAASDTPRSQSLSHFTSADGEMPCQVDAHVSETKTSMADCHHSPR